MSSKSTTKTTLALIPYLNCEPFYAGLDELDFEIVQADPRRLGQLAEEGVAAAGPMAVADWFRLEDRFEPLGDFAIACEGSVYSVLFFARRSIDRLSGGRIGLTSESSTSVKLLRLVLERKHLQVGLEYSRELEEDDDGLLLIGDEALRAGAEGLDRFPFVYDLGQEWHGWRALPFVFARWVVSKDVPQDDRRAIARSLEVSLAGWQRRLPEIAARRGRALGLDGQGVRRYLSTFTYRLGPVEEMGLRAFREMLEEDS
jgi:chorismate dehydratase